MNVKAGLKLLPPDERDYRLGEIIKLPALSELPPSFSLGEPKVLDQEANGDLDGCTAYATCVGAKFQDGVDLYPPFVFAASNPGEGFGQDLRTMMKAWRDYGCAEENLVPQEIKHLPKDKRRYFSNYPQFLKINAQDYIKPSFFAVTGQYDFYDNIRASIYAYRHKKQAVYFGLLWHWDLSQYILEDIGNYGTGHAMVIIGWDAEGLIVVNSYGQRAGRNGQHRITREMINHYAPIYGCYMMTDIPQEEARKLLKKKQNTHLKMNLNLMEKVLLLMKQLIQQIWR